MPYGNLSQVSFTYNQEEFTMKFESEDLSQEAKAQMSKLAFWGLAYVLTTALVVFGSKFLWDEHKLASMLAILVNLYVGVSMFAANHKFIFMLDELQQRIQINALAFAVGVGVIGGLSFSMLDITNLISGDAEISIVVLMIGFTYIGGIFYGQRVYR